ncbi:MAG: peptidase S53 [Mycobacteriaceae bacterium]|nr:peptidase S53 [Mycobacteriaceae bacterium]
MRRLLALVAAAVLLLPASDLRVAAPNGPPVIGGPFARLLAGSTDLGPSPAARATLTVTLTDSARPDMLIGWAATHGLSVRWRPGDRWASVAGHAADVARAFGVPVNDYRGHHGQVFYASPQQPGVPATLDREVSGLGRILGYTPHHLARPVFHPLDVPRHGLTPAQLLTTYNAAALTAAGFTRKGATIVFFEFDGYDQADLDAYTEQNGLPKFTPTMIGGRPGEAHGESVMDLEVAHAVAPDARLVTVNALPTVQGDGAYQKLAQLFDSVDRQFPGAVWSLSIGWGCDKLLTAADLAPVHAAITTAQAHGTTAFDASGDTGGLECKGNNDWSGPPGPDDVGVDGVGSLPAMTSVGGTTLSTDANGVWLSEQAWSDSPLSQGTSGGVSVLFSRPAWQNELSVERDSAHRRLVPDVAADADPFTGARIVFNQRRLVGAGTSQAAPIWAALTVLMNQYLQVHGGRPVGNLNPLLYRIAAGANRPGFRDVSLGGNAVDLAVPGYDLVTGLGSPNVDSLVRDLLDIQTGMAPR